MLFRSDLEIAKKGKTGHNLQQIQKQLNHLQRLGAGSLNEEEKSEDSTGLEGFLEKMCHKLEKDGVDYAERIKILGKELNKNFDIKKKNISEDSDSLTDKFISGFEKKVPENPSETPEEKQKRIDAKLADLKDKEQTRRKEAGEVEEGVGTGLSIKKGMNVKPTHENINEIIGGQGMFDIHANDIVKLMDKNKTYTDGEFLSIISRYGHGIPTSSMNAITKGLKKSLERKGYKFEPITQEGIGLGLNIKKGMNVKPTHGK